jgi:hypothetical protein
MVVAGLAGSGCASRYWADRGRDAQDVLTCAVGLGLGVKARVGPVQAPLIVQSDYAGLRCGEWFASPMRDDFWTYVSEAGHVVDQPLPIYERDYHFLYSGYEVFDPGGRRPRGTSGRRAWASAWPRSNAISGTARFIRRSSACGRDRVGRLGVNPGELADLLLGFAGLDVMGDDEGRTGNE